MNATKTCAAAAFVATLIVCGSSACGSTLSLPTHATPSTAPSTPPAITPTINPTITPTQPSPTSQVPAGFFSGDTSDVPTQIADRLGCTDVASDPQLDRYTDGEVTCLFDGDNEVSIFAFASSAREQSWFALGPQSSSESGSVVAGDTWAVEPGDSTQTTAIRTALGAGTILQQP